MHSLASAPRRVRLSARTSRSRQAACRRRSRPRAPSAACRPLQPPARADELLAAMPLGMETVYQKVLLPGEIDQLFAGQVETIRGLVYPYEAVRGLHTPP